MRSNVQLIRKRVDYLLRMRNYLNYSYEQILRIVPVEDFDALTPEQHEALAAFRVRFSEFQEHLGKLMRAIAREEEQETEPFSFVLLYMEKIGILDSAMRWKMIRELRNAINHEYEEDGGRLFEFLSKIRRKPCPSGRGWIAWPLQVACFSLVFVVVRYIPE